MRVHYYRTNEISDGNKTAFCCRNVLVGTFAAREPGTTTRKVAHQKFRDDTDRPDLPGGHAAHLSPPIQSIVFRSVLLIKSTLVGHIFPRSIIDPRFPGIIDSHRSSAKGRDKKSVLFPLASAVRIRSSINSS